MELWHYEDDGVALIGELYAPTGSANGRAVLVAHEADGIGGNVRRHCVQLADLGYIAAAADLHGGGRVLAPDEIPAMLESGALPVGARAAGHDCARMPEFGGATQRVRILREIGEDRIEMRVERDHVAGFVDEAGADAVALRAPQILRRDRARRVCQVAVELGIAVDAADKAAIERRDRQRVLKPRWDRPIADLGPSRPLARLRAHHHLQDMTDTIAHLGLIDEDELLLDTAALELAALDHPGVDLSSYAALLSTMSGRLAELGGDARTGAARARLLARVIGGEYGFAGDGETYDDPANADMIRVIERRRGLPVSLSILYVATARRLGWAADALNSPGHVVVRIGAGSSAVLIDPFRGGRAMEPEQLERLGTAMGGGAPTAAHIAPMTNREVLSRLLLNQATRAEQGGDAARALTLYARMTAFAPANAHAWWQRARLELTGEDVGAARASLTAVLEVSREPQLRARVSDILERLASTSG